MARKTEKYISSSILSEIQTNLDQLFENRVDFTDDTEIAGWFMGPRGENQKEASRIISSILKKIMKGRKDLFPGDPNYITDEVKASEGYQRGISRVEEQTHRLVEILNKFSLPTQSLRYQGHMLWDITLPSMAGYFAAMLQNQNNVTPQASPATTILELMVCNDIARMTGFRVKALEDNTPDKPEDIYAWAHISCDGSIANIESLWAAREVKFLPLGIKYALNQGEYLFEIRENLMLQSGLKIADATAWELLNLSQDEILGLPEKIHTLLNSDDIKLSDVWETLSSRYSLNARGYTFFYTQYLFQEDILMPAVITPSTRHYSWPKASSVLGMGNGQKGLEPHQLTDINTIAHDGLINIYVDSEGRMNTRLLKDVLTVCKDHKKPVVMVVGVMGTTEEGAVDPMEKLLAIRDDFRRAPDSPFEYSLHADAAWGGYFLSCFRTPFDMERYPTENSGSSNEAGKIFTSQGSWFRDSVYTSMTAICRCDSVTIDPHKMGYMPYPAGSLTYRNNRIINLLTYTAPYISSGSFQGINTRNIGECGLEGSKPGASAASVYLSHMVIRPDQRGYGKIISQSMQNSKLFYLYLCTLHCVHPEDKFEIVMFDELPEAIDPEEVAEKLWKDNFQLSHDSSYREVQNHLRNIAGDQNVVDYIFIDKNDRSLERTRELNNTVFEKLNLAPGSEPQDNDIFVSETTFHKKDYGPDFMKALAMRLGLSNPREIEEADEIPCIRSVIMDPWAIFTHKNRETRKYNFFTDIFIPRLRAVVNELCS